MKEGQPVMALRHLLLYGLMGLVASTSKHLDLHEGDTCKQINGTRWLCKKIKDCLKFTKNIDEWESNQPCKRKGRDNIVCCEPKAGEKAKQMCQKYSEAVFVKIPDAYPANSFTEYDSCFVYEELATASRGEDVHYREFPHIVLIGSGNASYIDWWCGGSLISDRFVLSAAHCSMSGKRKASLVRLGEYNLWSKADEDNGFSNSIDYMIEAIINHPNYSSSSFHNDIVLFKLNTTVVFDAFIRPVCLHTDYTIPEGTYLTAGWGITEWGGRKSDILQKMKVLITPSSECQQAYNTSIENGSIICAGNENTAFKSCPGDSGGPLQVRYPEVYCMFLQIGITSFGSMCPGNRPGVYTRVSHYIAWIESVVWP